MCLICDRIQAIKDHQNPFFVRELETGYVVLGDHQYFEGYTLFLCKRHESELFDLEDKFCARFLQEMTMVAQAVSRAFQAGKMNYELLGNGDSHLHWHLFPRKDGDLGEHGINGNGPVWLVPPKVMYSDDSKPSTEVLTERINRLKKELKILQEESEAEV